MQLLTDIKQKIDDSKSEVDINFRNEIMTPEEVAQYLRKSLSWVYKNWKILGGRKLRGSLFFPGKEDLYERLFYKGKGVEVRLHPEGNQAYGNLVQNQKRGKGRRIQEKRGGEESKAYDPDPNRHGILGAGE